MDPRRGGHTGVSRQQGPGWRMAAIVVTATSLLGHTGAVAVPADEDATDDVAAAVRAEFESVRRTLTAAVEALEGARAAGRSADGQVRGAEEQLAPAIEARWAAEDRVDDAEVVVGVATRRLERAVAQVQDLSHLRRQVRADLETARRNLEERVVRAYKTGSLAAESTLPLTIVREASSPGELATAVKQLETVMLAGAENFDDVLARLVQVEADLAAARLRRSAANDELADAQEELAAADVALETAAEAGPVAEAAAAARRRAADEAEARLLATLRRALDAEAAAARAAAAVADAEDVAAGAPSGPDHDDAGTLEDRRDWLASRQRALARARSLPDEDRRTAEGWVCPVDGGGFVNDWAFPRSGDRRHEGTDVFAPEGTPIVAPAAGVVTRLNSVDRYDGRRGLGGLTVSIEDGRERWYHAHLSGIHPDLVDGGEVAAGQVIGWVGRTGNARGTPPHLHIGWYADGVAVNAYPSLVLACRSDLAPARVAAD